jgi:hypothetical protein
VSGNRLLNAKSLLVAGICLIAALVVYYGSFLSGRTYLWEDLLFYAYPSAKYFAQALHAGRFPLWISGMHDGLPFYTNLNLTAFYPPLWLLALGVPAGKVSYVAFQCYLVLQLFIGGILTFLFLRDQRMSPVASMTGMIVFVFSAFMSLHLIHSNVITAYLWLPLQLMFVSRVVGRPFAPWNYLGLIVAILMSFLAGFPQVVMYNSYFLIACWITLYFLRSKRDGVVGLSIARSVLGEVLKIGVVFILVILVGAAQFIPVAENWSLSNRQEFSFEIISDLSMPWYYLLHGLVPNLFGASSGTGGGVPFWGFNKDTADFKNFQSGAWMYWEFGFYAGQLALISIAVMVFNFKKCWRERRELMFFLIALPVVLLLMVGRYGGLFNILYHVAPGFSMFRTPARAGCLFDICAVVLAAGLVDMLITGRPALNLKRPFLFISGGYLVFSLWLVFDSMNRFPELADVRLMKHALSQAGLSIIFFAGTVFLLLGLRKHVVASMSGAAGIALFKQKWFGGVCASGLMLLVFLDLYLAFHEFHPGATNPDEYYADRSGLMAQMSTLRDQAGPFRFAQLRGGKMSEEIIFPRNMGYLHPEYEALEGYILFGIKTWCGFNSITNERVKLDIQNVGLVANLDNVSRRVSLVRYTNSLPRAKFYHAIKTFETDRELWSELEAGHLDYHHTAGVLRTECAQFGVVTTRPPVTAQAEVRFISKTPDEYQLSYRSTAPGVIFISENYYPGWQASIGDKCLPMVRVFGAFKGVVVPESGAGIITLRFVPHTFIVGLIISAVTCVVLVVGAALLSRTMSRRDVKPVKRLEMN